MLTAGDGRVLAAALAVVAAMMKALVILMEGRAFDHNLHWCGAQCGAGLMADAWLMFGSIDGLQREEGTETH